MGDISFGFAEYLGGHPDEPKTKTGNLIFGTDSFGIGTFSPKHPSIAASDIVAIDVGGQQIVKNNTSGRLLMGVLASGTKTRDETHLVVALTNGHDVFFKIDRKRPEQIEPKISAWMTEHSIMRGPRPALQNGAAPAANVADQLGQIAALHESGALSADEYSAAKARILGQ